jgi:hypothetical protein
MVAFPMRLIELYLPIKRIFAHARRESLSVAQEQPDD